MALRKVRSALGRGAIGGGRGLCRVDVRAPGTHIMTSTAPLPQALAIPSPLRRAVMLVGDVVGTMGVVLVVPFVILAIGMPIALALRVLLWIVDLF